MKQSSSEDDDDDDDDDDDNDRRPTMRGSCRHIGACPLSSG